MNIRNRKDFYAGLIFVAFGVFFMAVARNYPMGSALRMGPGYFPFVLGGLLTLLGFAVAARSLVLAGGAVGRLAVRPLMFVLGGVVAFAVLINTLGLVVATCVLVFVSALASGEFRVRGVAVLCAILVALALGVFVYGLKLPFKVLPF